MTGSLSADIVVNRGPFPVSAAFDVEPGRCLAILGPNGAGKSTILAALAGLAPLASGTVCLNGRVLERAGDARVPPEGRGVALLDQRSRLFPHLTVEKNLSFGPRALGLPRAQVWTVVDQWLGRLGLADRARAKPHELSGGQQQRVAIARAFASRPSVLLLDEPFASLDVESGPIVRRVLAEELAQTGTTAVLVTHQLADAWQWADECLVLDRGRVVEQGAPDQLTMRPRREFTALLAGFGVLRGRWTGSALSVRGAELPGEADQVFAGRDAVGIVAPRDLVVSTRSGRPGALTAVVTGVSVQAGVVRLDTDAGITAELTVDVARTLGDGAFPSPGDSFDFAPRGLRVVPADE
ncbi:MAG: ATP-binding cassette domain-containing protein [Gordonia sp. (in: high G+C Gram-positive bacteria)]|jgi:molybdate transport system ATP-binding protein|nr:ATP-binding cassette domain-containing protein [Gordonia sp. (in: high G+C Gram-positive bacteria)]